MGNHWRTSRTTPSGGIGQLSGSPHGSKYALPANSILSPGFPLERREISEPSLDERELGSGFLFLSVVLGPLLLVAAVVIGYQAFVS
jgi:hypothetical protein